MEFKDNPIIAILGLGYVGLPLAVAFSKKYNTIGFDIDTRRIKELQNGKDITLTLSDTEVAKCNFIFTNSIESLKEADIYIVTVPTPIDQFNKPDLTPLLRASQMIGKVISKGNIVIYESTVYPGATEEECIPEVVKASKLTFNHDFYVGYSPERISPGDKEHSLYTIKKVTSGSTKIAADYIDKLYASIITAGTHLAPTIKIAEASKVIENTQRDLNIAIINEFAQIFNAMNIDTADVLKAANTKWNFLPFSPGLVGGHCIGVDPYYLNYKSQNMGYVPDMLVAGRRINDGMGSYISNQVMILMLKRDICINGSKILILGFTFKENCPDIRNSRVVDIAKCLDEMGARVDMHDPLANAAQVKEQYDISLILEPDFSQYNAIILAVAHDEYIELGAKNIRKMMKNHAVLYDVKSVLSKNLIDGRL